ncbi:uncharacterized protein LOC143180995 [Calliopsis andreniformis]|uniref:uncharacterized protein LOC143180995 n=1 Tax=Calliopsis andreniformis TaxID=337506 RepID=UPI003FCE187B
MLATRDYHTGTVLLSLLRLSFSAMVLPRPPSSPNHIQQEQGLSSRKIYEGKALQSFLQSSNIKRPSVNDYSLVEIELQSPDEIDTTNLQDLVHTVLKRPEEIHNTSYPNPEVIPHSIFGVRDFGLSPNFKLKTFDETKHTVASPAKYENIDGKLYYLKNNRPKVYVNIRSHSGSFRKDLISKTTSSSDLGFVHSLRMTPYLQKQTEWKTQHSKKGRPPKKFDRRMNINNGHQKSISSNKAKKLSRLDSVYGLDDLSTTENSMVTSSELPKQIPAPPSRFSSRSLMVQTTPVQRYALGRMDILPGYSLSDI